MPTFWQAVITAAFVLAGVVFTQWQIRKAAEKTAIVENRKVDAEAYDRARKFDQSVVDGIKDELARARDEIAQLRTTLDTERREHYNEARELRQHIDRLERIVARLTRRLRDAGLDVDPEEKVV